MFAPKHMKQILKELKELDSNRMRVDFNTPFSMMGRISRQINKGRGLEQHSRPSILNRYIEYSTQQEQNAHSPQAFMEHSLR